LGFVGGQTQKRYFFLEFGDFSSAEMLTGPEVMTHPEQRRFGIVPDSSGWRVKTHRHGRVSNFRLKLNMKISVHLWTKYG
jgi:hypothetical protein